MDSKDCKLIDEGSLPSEIMYGCRELKELGYDVDVYYSKPKYMFSNLIIKINNKFSTNIKEIRTLLTVRKYDVIVAKDRFSTTLTLACKIFNKKIVYIDSLFRVPRNTVNRFSHWLNLKLSDGVVVYSDMQIKIWSNEFKISVSKFRFIPYTIDYSFYTKNLLSQSSSEFYILSVGRDIARDYKTLFEAMNGLNVNLKIVSLKYLLEGISIEQPWLEIYEHIPYEKLFELYRNALFIVIPLKEWGVIYPSGIRGLLEAMALEKAVISSKSPVLEEYVGEDSGVVFVDPEDPTALRTKIIELLESETLRGNLEQAVAGIVRDRYNMNVFAKQLGDYLTELCSLNK